MNKHFESLISFIGIIVIMHYDIIFFYLSYRYLRIKKYNNGLITFIKVITIICGLSVYLSIEGTKLFSDPLVFVFNLLMAYLLYIFGRWVTVKSNYFYFWFDQEFFEFWNKNIRGR